MIEKTIFPARDLISALHSNTWRTCGVHVNTLKMKESASKRTQQKRKFWLFSDGDWPGVFHLKKKIKCFLGFDCHFRVSATSIFGYQTAIGS